MSAEILYAVREVGGESIPGYAIYRPGSMELISNRSIPNGYCEQPLTFPLALAQAHAQALSAHHGKPWIVELAPNPCPSCGRVIWADDRDFCYPTSRERTRWRAGCNEHDFGCGFELEASSWDEAMRRWNAR